MTKPKPKKSNSKPKPDVMHGRDFAGAAYAATEREQTEDVGIDVARLDANPLATEVYAALSG